jgi:glycosyltransferase involved in cell wall biosynthesis
MKILFFTPLYYPHIGGVEKHVEKISRLLVENGHQVTIVTSQHDGSTKLEENSNKIRIYRIPYNLTLRKLKLWKWMWQHRQLVLDADIIHAHDVFWWYLPFRLIYPYKQVYTTFHGWEGVFPPTRKAKFWRKLSERLSLGNICVGDYIKIWYQTEPNYITYGGTDQQDLELGNTNHICVVGRLSHDNNMHDVIEALAAVKEKLPQVKVRFLGDGECAWEANRVGEVLGFQKDLGSHLADCHWVIASSYLSMIDSMAAGRQVFSIYSNPLKKDYLTMFPGTKWLKIAANTKELSDALMFCLMDPDAKNKVSEAQVWAKQQSWEKVLGLYLKLWQKK